MRSRITNLAILLAALAIPAALFFISSTAHAQPIQQATKEVDIIGREEKRRAEQKMMAPPKRPPGIKEEVEAPVEKVGPVFFIKKVDLLGAKTFPPEKFKPTIEKYENREVYLGELKALAKKIEREYLKEGVIAACFVPEQEIKDGLVTLRVVEAKMGELVVKKNKYFSSERLKYYWTTKQGEVVRYDRMSRNLQMMNKNSDRRVAATIYAGAAPETSDIQLDATTNFPYHITATADREGGPSTGVFRGGLGLIVNNLIGLDDTAFGGYTGGEDFGGVYIYHKVPLTYFGTSLLYGFTESKAFPKGDLEFLGLNSTSQNLSFYLYQDLYYKADYKGDVYFGLDANNKRSVYYGGTTAADRLRVIRAGHSLLARGYRDVAYIKGEISQGLNFLGARRKSDYSSRDAENTFTKGILNVNYRYAFPKNIQLYGRFSAQAAEEKLMPQEQFYVGGIDSVRGYPAADYLADTALFGSVELQVPAFIIPEWVRFPYGERPIRDEITGVAFFDYGCGMQRGDIQGEVSKQRLASVGAGVRARIFNQATVRLEFGYPLPFANKPLTQSIPWRTHFSVDFQDDMPEEMERLAVISREEYAKESAWNIVNAEMNSPDSPLGAAIRSHLDAARKSYASGDYESARAEYKKVYDLGDAAHKQTEVYVRESYKQVEDLKRKNELAEKYYKEGSYDKVREISESVKQDAQIKKLAIDLIQ